MAPPSKSSGPIADLSGNRFGAQSGPGKPGAARAPGRPGPGTPAAKAAFASSAGPGAKASAAAEAAASSAKGASILKLPKGLEWYGRASGLAFEVDDGEAEVAVVKLNPMLIAGAGALGLLLLAGAGWG